jgi:hypothetical protein
VSKPSPSGPPTGTTLVMAPRIFRPPATIDDGALQSAVKASADSLGKNTEGRIGFAAKPLATTQKFNPLYWKPLDVDNGVWEVGTANKIPDVALFDIVDNPKAYTMECASAIKVVLNLALLRTLGTERFRRAVADAGGLRIGPGVYEAVLQKAMKRETSSSLPADKFPGMASADFQSTIMPGDAVYMINLAPTPFGVQAGWRGENALALGGGNFFGHGVPNSPYPVTADTIKNHMMTPGLWDRTPEYATAIGPDRAEPKVKNGPPWWVDEYFHLDASVVKTLGLP